MMGPGVTAETITCPDEIRVNDELVGMVTERLEKP